MDIQTVGIVGAGQMGSGIALVFAMAGFQSLLVDVGEPQIQKGLQSVEEHLQKMVDKNRISPAGRAVTVSRIRTSTDLEELKNADFLIEAVTENWEIKKTLLQQLDTLLPLNRIFATNTSSLSITRLAAQTHRPERFIGMHFMNPVHVMPLVEIVRGLATSDDTTIITSSLAERLGKTAIQVNDSPGFVANRLLLLMINEAVWALQEGVADAESIDTIMKLGTRQPMGPLALADFMGLDTCLSMLNVMQQGFGDPKYRPCPLLAKHVLAGWLGRKTGRGFFVYTPSQTEA